MKILSYQTNCKTARTAVAISVALTLISCASPENGKPELAVRTSVISADLNHKVYSLGNESIFYLYDIDGKNYQFKWNKLSLRSPEQIGFSNCLERNFPKKMSPWDENPTLTYPAVKQCFTQSAQSDVTELALPDTTRFTVLIQVQGTQVQLPPVSGTPLKWEGNSGRLGSKFEVSKDSTNFQKVKQDVGECKVESMKEGVVETDRSDAQSSYVPMLNYSRVSIGPMVERFQKCLTLRQYAIKEK